MNPSHPRSVCPEISRGSDRSRRTPAEQFRLYVMAFRLRRLGTVQLSSDVGSGEGVRGAGQPSVEQRLPQGLLADDLQLHEDRRVAVEVLDGEDALHPGG